MNYIVSIAYTMLKSLFWQNYIEILVHTENPNKLLSETKVTLVLRNQREKNKNKQKKNTFCKFMRRSLLRLTLIFRDRKGSSVFRFILFFIADKSENEWLL